MQTIARIKVGKLEHPVLVRTNHRKMQVHLKLAKGKPDPSTTILIDESMYLESKPTLYYNLLRGDTITL